MRKILGFVFIAVCAMPVLGQSNYASLTGIVTDAQHLPVAGGTILLTAASTGASRHVVTSQDGCFEVAALLPDDYELKTPANGFATATQSLRLEVGQKLALEISLKVGAVTEGVQVTAANEVLRTTDASVGEMVEPQFIRELPLNGRMLIDLVLTVPGAHVGIGAQTGSTNPLYWRPGQLSAVVIGGSRPNANYFLLDGATNTDPTFSTQNLSPSPDAVREFQVETSSYTADMSGAGGGQINIVTHSGTILGENPIRANYTGKPIFGPGTHTATKWFNPAAFATPPAFTYGNVGRNSVYGPGMQTLDLAITRVFRLTERANFQFRAGAFNALNQVNLGTPNRFVNTPQFGPITMAMTPGREIQLGARISF